MIGALAIPFQFVAALLQRWVLPNFMCAFCPFVQIVSVNVSIFTLTAIAADRYLVVVHPMNLRINKDRAKRIIVVIWIIAIIVAIPAAVALRVNLVPNVDDSIRSQAMELLKEANVTSLPDNFPSIPLKYTCDNFGVDASLWKWYNRILVIIQYILPVSILIFAYGKMGMQLTDRGTRDKIPEDKVSENRIPSFAGDSRDNRSPSEIELSHPSKQQTSTTLRASDHTMNPTTHLNNEKNRTPSLSTNAEYIATNKRRVCMTLVRGFLSID
jgi:hypothetical protein